MEIAKLRLKRNSERGAALIGALLLLFMLTAMAVAVTYLVMSEIRVSGSDREMNSAYYGAEAGMEKMMTDLSALYQVHRSPTATEIQALAATPPSLPGIVFPGTSAYEFKFPLGLSGGSPISQVRTISAGPNAGLHAQVIPLQLNVTAQRPGSPQVKMTRNIEVALIPVFQFGVFSEADLSYFAGPDFFFGGRVHTNGNLFLADTGTLTFNDKITAVGEVVRHQLSNGVDTVTSGRTGAVMIPDGVTATSKRDLKETEGSVVGGVGSAATTTPIAWTTISSTTYHGNIRNGATGVTPLSLPFVQAGTPPIEIIRRPYKYPSLTAPDGEDPTSSVGISREFNKAAIRILISDDPAELSTGGATDPDNVRLDNTVGSTYATGVPVATANAGYTVTFFAQASKAKPTVGAVNDSANWITPPGVTGGATATWPLLSDPATGSYLRVEIKKDDDTYMAVTREWLQLGFARGTAVPNTATTTANAVHPNAILIFQRPSDGISGLANQGFNWYPINLYDTREGEVRDTTTGKAAGSGTPNGIINVVELDVYNLKRWLAGAGAYAGLSGNLVNYQAENGYVLYFSDRRGMLREDPNDPTATTTDTSVWKKGEYGWEDNINASVAAGTPNGVVETAENVNGNTDSSGNQILDTYGGLNVGTGFGVSGNPISARVDLATIGKKNRVSGARHALKLINGTLGNLPLRPDNNAGGFTVASEQPVYIFGNYNANSSGFGATNEAASAVIADAVTLLSNNWSDYNSFTNSINLGGRTPNATYWRVAIAAGKNKEFTKPTWSGAPEDFGTDGGVHNFLRYLENWGGIGANYQGSLVSFYFAQYGNGVFKCCTTVYGAPNRNYSFDTNFLDPSKMPPGTPQFLDVVNVGYRQDFSRQ